MERNSSQTESAKLATAMRKRGAWASLSVSLFGTLFHNSERYPRISKDMKLSKLPYTLAEYLSMVTLSSILLGAAVMALVTLLALRMPSLAFLLYSIGFLIIIVLVALLLEVPSMVTKQRARDINAKLPVAIAFVATLASADVSVDDIVRELGEAREFGEISREARSISISSRMFGKDIITAIRDASRLSPSPRLADFLQGITTTVTTGGDLKLYFTTKSSEYYGEQENLIKKNSESVGIMSEGYITVGVAFPLILMIILGVVGALSPVSPASILLFIYLIALLMIPVLGGFFAYILRSTLKEVET